MPTYQYACTSCGEQSEVVQRFSDDPLTVCTACGGGLRKIFSPVGIVFKGSGFYRTDSRNGAAVNGKDKEPKPAANGSGDGSAPAGKKASTDSGSSAASTAKQADAKPAQPASTAPAS